MSLKKLLTYFNIPMILRKSFAPKLYIWKQHEQNTYMHRFTRLSSEAMRWSWECLQYFYQGQGEHLERLKTALLNTEGQPRKVVVKE